MGCICTVSPFGNGIGILNAAVQTVRYGSVGSPSRLQVAIVNVGGGVATLDSLYFSLSPGLTGVTFPKLPPGITATYSQVSGAVDVSGHLGRAVAPGESICFEIEFIQPALAVTYSFGGQGFNAATGVVGSGVTNADVSASITITPATGSASTVRTVTYTITNNGPDRADGATIAVDLAASGFVFAGYSTNGSAGVGTTNFSPMSGFIASPLPSGGYISAVVTGTFPNGTNSVTAVAAIGPYTESDPQLANNSATATVTTGSAASSADFGIARTATPTTVVQGNAITQPITVTNNGPAAAAATLAYTVPAGFTYLGASQGGAQIPQAVLAAGVTTGTMASGASMVFTVVIRADTVGLAQSIGNATVTATSPAVDPVGGNNTTASIAVDVNAASGSDTLSQILAAPIGQWGRFTGATQRQSYLPADGAPPFNSPSAGANEWGLATYVLPTGEKVDISVLGHTGFCAHKGLKTLAGAWNSVGAAPTSAQIIAEFNGTTDKRYSTGFASLEANHGHAYRRVKYDTTISKAILIKGAVPYPQANYSGDVFVHDPATYAYLPSGTAPNIGFVPLGVDERIAKIGRGYYLISNRGNSQQYAYHPVTGSYLYAELGWGNGIPAAFFYDATRGATGHGQSYHVESSGGNFLWGAVRRFDVPATNVTYNQTAPVLDWSAGAPVTPDTTFLTEWVSDDSLLVVRPSIAGEVYKKPFSGGAWVLHGQGGTVPSFPPNGIFDTLTLHERGGAKWLEGAFERNTGNDFYYRLA